MKKSFVFTLFLATIIFIKMPGLLFSANPQWKIFSAKDLQIQDNADHLCVDKNNYIWATNGGGIILKYNGSSWQYYDDIMIKTSVHTTSVCPKSISPDNDGNIWISNCTQDLIKFDGKKWSYYDTVNSSLTYSMLGPILPLNNYLLLGIDACCLARFDGTNCTIYNNSNSSLPHTSLGWILKDKNNNIWLAGDKGLIKFDGASFIVYDTTNSQLPGYDIYGMAIDKNNNIWLCFDNFNHTEPGPNAVSKFDGTNWTIFTENSIGISGLWATSIAVDSNNNIFVGSIFSGLIKYDGTNWTSFNKSNSQLTTNVINSIAVDKNNNKWIGTDNGIAVYNENGVVITSVHESKATPTGISIYPNPGQKSFTIKYTVKSQGMIKLNIVDVAGKQVSVLVSERKAPGEYSSVFDASGLSAGTYIVQYLSSGGGMVTNKFVIEK